MACEPSRREAWHSVRAKRGAQVGFQNLGNRSASLHRKAWQCHPKGVRRVGALFHRESELTQGREGICAGWQSLSFLGRVSPERWPGMGFQTSGGKGRCPWGRTVQYGGSPRQGVSDGRLIIYGGWSIKMMEPVTTGGGRQPV